MVGVGVASCAAMLLAVACVPPPAPPVVEPPPAPPASTTRALWPMDEASGKVMHDAVKPAHDGVIAAGVTLGGGSYDFPGWKNNVDAAGNLFGAISDSTGSVSVADAGHVLEPVNGTFSVNGKIRTRLAPTGQLPVGTVGSAYNVVQKARASNLGGFWKMEIRGNGNGTGHVRCTLGDGRLVLVVESTNRVDDGNWHTFGCNLSLGAFTVIVDGVATSIDATSLGGVHPVEQFSQSVVLGKKPGSTDPSDSFSGWLDDVSIAAG